MLHFNPYEKKSVPLEKLVLTLLEKSEFLGMNIEYTYMYKLFGICFLNIMSEVYTVH